MIQTSLIAELKQAYQAREGARVELKKAAADVAEVKAIHREKQTVYAEAAETVESIQRELFTGISPLALWNAARNGQNPDQAGDASIAPTAETDVSGQGTEQPSPAKPLRQRRRREAGEIDSPPIARAAAE